MHNDHAVPTSPTGSMLQQRASAETPRTSWALTTIAYVSLAGLAGLILWIAGEVLLLIFTGLLLATLLIRLSQMLERRTGLSYNWSLAVVLIVMALALVTLCVLFATRVAGEADELFKTLQSKWQQLADRISQYQWAPKVDGSSSLESLQGLQGEWVYRIAGIFSTTFGIFGSVILVLFVGIFTAADPQLYRRGLMHLVPIDRRERVSQVLDETSDKLWWWVLGQLFSMSVVGIATGIGLWLLGIPFAATLGLLSGLLTFIPNFGPILSALPAILLGLTTGWMQAIYVIVLYVSVQAVESNLLTPLVQQRNIKLPPVLNVGIQILLGVLFGVAGLIVAAPLAVVLMVLTQHFYVEDTLGDRLTETKKI